MSRVYFLAPVTMSRASTRFVGVPTNSNCEGSLGLAVLPLAIVTTDPAAAVASEP